MNSTVFRQRSLKDIVLRTLKSSRFQKFALCGIAVLCGLYQVWNANWMFVWAVVASVVSLITGAILAAQDYFYRNKLSELRTERLWWNIKALIAVLFLTSNWFYTSAFQVAIVGANGHVRYWPGGLAITHFTPFIDEAYSYQDVLSKRTSCAGDGISFMVSAQLLIPFEALPTAHERIGSWTKVEKVVGSELCNTIDSQALARAYIAGTPPSTFIIEQKVLDERSHLNDFGVFYNGAVEVSNIHAYLVQK